MNRNNNKNFQGLFDNGSDNDDNNEEEIEETEDKIINKEKKLIEKDIFIIKYIGTINLLTNNPNNYYRKKQYLQ